MYAGLATICRRVTQFCIIILPIASSYCFEPSEKPVSGRGSTPDNTFVTTMTIVCRWIAAIILCNRITRKNHRSQLTPPGSLSSIRYIPNNHILHYNATASIEVDRRNDE
jgi:hypothetical protein